MVMTFSAAFLFSVYNGPSAAVVDELGPPQYGATLAGGLHVRPPRPRQRARPVGGRRDLRSLPHLDRERRCRRPTSPSLSPASSSWWSPPPTQRPRLSLSHHVDIRPHHTGLLRSLRRRVRGRAAPRLPPPDRRAGAGSGAPLRQRQRRLRGRLRHRPPPARGRPRGPLGRRPRSVARNAAAGAGARPPRRPGLAHRRAAAVGVVRSRLQHEGAGPRAAHRAGGRRAGAPGPPRRPPAARVLQPAVAALSGQARWAAPGRSPPTGRPRRTSTPASIRCRARAATCRPASIWSPCAACAW